MGFTKERMVDEAEVYGSLSTELLTGAEHRLSDLKACAFKH